MTQQKFTGSPEQHLKWLDNALSKAVVDGVASNRDIELIKGYLSDRYSRNLCCERELLKNGRALIFCHKFLSINFEDATYQDIVDCISKIKTTSKASGEQYRPSTIRSAIWSLRSFYQYLIDEGLSAISIQKISSIKLPSAGNKNTVTPEMLPTLDEMIMLFSGFDNLRDVFFFKLQFYGGFRIGEISTLRWKDILYVPSTDTIPEHLMVSITFKTDVPRLVPVYNVCEDYRAWRKMYPKGEPNPSDFVITKMHSRDPISYTAIRSKFDLACKRAGITKKLHPHLLRHKFICAALTGEFNGMPVPSEVIRKTCWGNHSNMLEQTYSHLTGAQTELLLGKSNIGYSEGFYRE